MNEIHRQLAMVPLDSDDDAEEEGKETGIVPVKIPHEYHYWHVKGKPE